MPKIFASDQAVWATSWEASWTRRVVAVPGGGDGVELDGVVVVEGGGVARIDADVGGGERRLGVALLVVQRRAHEEAGAALAGLGGVEVDRGVLAS